MTPLERAIRYFSLFNNREFWRWGQDTAEGIRWQDGDVIISGSQIEATLEHLAPVGWPRFGAVVQLAAGCCEKSIEVEWTPPSDGELTAMRLPCFIRTAGRRIFESQRVVHFGDPETISLAASRLPKLPLELGELLHDPRALPTLAELLLPGEGSPNTEGILPLFSSHRLNAQELNCPPHSGKYPSILMNLAALGKSLSTLPPDELRARLLGQMETVGRTRVPLAARSRNRCRVINQFELPAGMEYRSVTPCLNGFCAAGVAIDGALAVTRCSFDGVAQVLRWPNGNPNKPLLLITAGPERILFHQPNSPMLPDQFLPPLPGTFRNSVVIGCAGWVPEKLMQFAWNEGHVWVLARFPARTEVRWRHSGDAGYRNAEMHPPTARDLAKAREPGFEIVYEKVEVPEHLALAVRTSDGTYSGGHAGPEFQFISGHPEPPPPMIAMQYNAAIAIDTKLLVFDQISLFSTYSFDEPIRKLFTGKAGTSTAIVLCFDQAVKLHWLGADDILTVVEGVGNPVAALTPDGKLVIAGDDHGSIYWPSRCGVECIEDFPWDGPAPLAIIAMEGERFATITTRGAVQIWNS